jgi:hypothetical protein
MFLVIVYIIRLTEILKHFYYLYNHKNIKNSI